MAQYGFGVGQVAVVPSGANPTPVQIGVIKDVTLDISMTVKELRGAYQFPVDVARAAGTISGKGKFAQIGSGTMAAVLATTASAGMKIGATTASTNIPTTPFTITPSVGGGGGTFFEDLGVINASTGVAMKRVASAPATGEYSVAAGVYTFAAADTGVAVIISYSYAPSGSTGWTVTYTNQLMGASTVFSLSLFNSFRSKNYGFRLPQVTIPKLAFAMKQDDYTDMDFDFNAFADSAGKVIDFFSTE